MPTPIDVAQGVVVDIGIPIERLGVPRLRHQGVGLQEAAQGRIIEPCSVIVEPEGRLPPLAGVEAIGDHCPQRIPRPPLAVRPIADRPHPVSTAIGC